jgi:hypothetical protein
MEIKIDITFSLFTCEVNSKVPSLVFRSNFFCKKLTIYEKRILAAMQHCSYFYFLKRFPSLSCISVPCYDNCEYDMTATTTPAVPLKLIYFRVVCQPHEREI